MNHHDYYAYKASIDLCTEISAVWKIIKQLEAVKKQSSDRAHCARCDQLMHQGRHRIADLVPKNPWSVEKVEAEVNKDDPAQLDLTATMVYNGPMPYIRMTFNVGKEEKK